MMAKDAQQMPVRIKFRTDASSVMMSSRTAMAVPAQWGLKRSGEQDAAWGATEPYTEGFAIS